MPVSSDRTPPGTGMSLPGLFLAGRFAGSRPWPVFSPGWPKDSSSREKTDEKSLWIPSEPLSFRYNDQTQESELVLGTRKCPVHPLSMSRSRPGRGFSPSPRRSPMGWTRTLGLGCFRKRNPGENPGLQQGRDYFIHGWFRAKYRLSFCPEDPDKEEGTTPKTQVTKTGPATNTGRRTGRRRNKAWPGTSKHEKCPEGCDPQGHPCLRLRSAQEPLVEDLKVKPMTKKPDPRQDGSGRYVRKEARAKAGLNRVGLSSCAAGSKTTPFTTPGGSSPEGISVFFGKKISRRSLSGTEGPDHRNN